MKITHRAFLAITAFLSALSNQAQELKSEDEQAFRDLFPSNAKVETLGTDFQFTEGPSWVGAEDGYLIFSDIPANKIYNWNENFGFAVFRVPSQQSNGNNLDLQGRIVTAEHWGRKVSLQRQDGLIVTLLDNYRGNKFNSPNDVVVKSDGTIWFTDPDYGLRDRPRELEKNNVFRYAPLTSDISVVVDDFVKPNGLCFSPDESKLYIADSGTPKPVRVFDVHTDGTISGGDVFAALDQGGPDGMRCDMEGNLWTSSGDGAQVFSPRGKLLARVLLPKGGANLCFGGPKGSTLYITARNAVYAVETKTRDAHERRID
ncbi:MAG: SMP-30/gluconolactonase/LRE family protein [Opitutales bacterium]|nr:SMP-30/gluconolactonase/LRE family protein [Opitutales bacterium]